MGNILAIVGRPNVGKSTLFNRLTESRQAIVEETSGVTRDRHYGRSDWNGVEFSVIDTGGYVVGSDDIFESEIRKQAQLAIEEADVIAFVVDTKEGLNSLDEEVNDILRRTEKKVFLIANKADNNALINHAQEFYALGYETVYPVSAINGTGTGELLDDITKEFGSSEEDITTDLPKFAVVGRPNVGKSSLINSIIGKERNIVTPIAGTTRDTVLTHYNKFGLEFVMIDTAGLRKKSKVHENIEFYSVLRSIRAIEKCDVCLLLIDATQGFEGQDLNIFHLADKNKKGIVILVNKWDLVEKKTNTHKEFEALIKRRTAPFSDVPVIFTSVLKKQRIFKALETAVEVYNKKTRRIPTSKLNEFANEVVNKMPPPLGSRERRIKIKYVTQLPVNFPAFAFFCNYPQEIRESYKRFLENKIRERFDYSGVPIQIYFRKK